MSARPSRLQSSGSERLWSGCLGSVTTRHGGGKPETPACTACHTANPKSAGQNAKTGKSIEPMAVSANAQRYTVKDDVEKWFGRNCREVLGRECTPVEKGDFVTFMSAQ
ncbi:MAG: DUF1924 domain-containing protein [Rhodospirillales bacterium]|nr:DUF1924 domain-containing protein [Rhodospirillales bacterium]